MGYFKCTICSIFEPFHFYLVMTLVGPCLDNIYIYGFADLCNCNNWCNETIGAMKPIFLDSGSPRGGGGLCMRGHGLLSLYSSYTKFKEKILFSLSLSNSNLCRVMLPNYLRTYSSALCQIQALGKAFKKQNNGQL